jgi:hypothetical protein
MKVSSDTDFIEVDVTKEMLYEANKRNQIFFEKYRNIGTNRLLSKNQRITGFLAEIAIKHIFTQLEYSETDDVDFVSRRDKTTFDSKAQGCNGKPQIDYVGTLYENQANRIFDKLIFSRVKNTLDKVWITGFIPKKEFLEIAKLMPAGTENNNFTYDEARYEIPYSLTYKPKLFIKG